MKLAVPTDQIVRIVADILSKPNEFGPGVGAIASGIIDNEYCQKLFTEWAEMLRAELKPEKVEEFFAKMIGIGVAAGIVANAQELIPIEPESETIQ